MSAIHDPGGDAPDDNGPARVGSAEPSRGIDHRNEGNHTREIAAVQARPVLNHPKIDACWDVSLLARKFDHHRKYQQHLFEAHELRSIAVREVRHDGSDCWLTIAWSDSVRGVDGFGVVALLGHLRRLDLAEAAHRALQFHVLSAWSGNVSYTDFVLEARDA